MKKKIQILICLAIAGLGFQTHKESKNFFEGKWTMCKHVCGDIETVSNVCTEFIFFANGSGELIKPGKKSKFRWKLNDETIDFNFDDKNDRNNFISKDSTFIYQTFDRVKNDELRIIEEDTKCEYILLKEKK